MTQTLRDPREVIREELLMHDPIRAAVAGGPATIAQNGSATPSTKSSTG
jgi:hypothetical protein